MDTKHTFVMRFPKKQSSLKMSRSDRFASDRQTHNNLREQVHRWIQSTQLDNHVEILPSGSPSNMIFITVDEDGEKALESVPFKADIGRIDDIEIELL